MDLLYKSLSAGPHYAYPCSLEALGYNEAMIVPEGEKPKLYVGCGLTLAPQEFKEGVEALKERLRDRWNVIEFLGLVAGTETDVYRQDIIRNVGGCEAFIGICDEPSTGLGWELSEASRLYKPSLAVAHAGSKVTRLVLGAPVFNPTLEFRTYENLVDDVPAYADEVFAGVLREPRQLSLAVS